MRRYDPRLSQDAEEALLKAGAWPQMTTSDIEPEDGSARAKRYELIWAVPLKQASTGHHVGYIPMGIYQSYHPQHNRHPELRANDPYYHDQFKEESGFDLHECVPPEGWKWFGATSSYIIQWKS